MKILYVVHRFLPCHLTGSEKVFAVLSVAVARATSHEVVVATGNIDTTRDYYHPPQTTFPGTEILSGVRVIRLKVNWAFGAVCYLLNRFLPFVDTWTRGAFGVFSLGPHITQLEDVMLQERPAVIHTGPAPLYHVYETGELALRHGIPLIISPMIHFDDVPAFRNPRLYALLAKATAVIVSTEYEKGRLIEEGVEPARISVIPPTFLSADDFESGDGQAFRRQHELGDDPMVLFLGSKDFGKGGLHVLEAWPTIRAAVPRARLVCAGTGTPRWNKAVRSKGLQGVIDLDYIDEKEKHNLLAACDLLCLPSQAESFGIVIAEAWAKRKPVIGGSAGATREMVTEGAEGFTVKFGDVAAISARVIELLSDPEARERLGRNGRTKAERWTEDYVVRNTVALYEKVGSR